MNNISNKQYPLFSIRIWTKNGDIYHCTVQGGVAFVWLPMEYSFVMKGLDKSCQKCYKVNFVFLRTILSWTVSVTVYILGQ